MYKKWTFWKWIPWAVLALTGCSGSFGSAIGPVLELPLPGKPDKEAK